MKFNALKKKIFKYNYDDNSYDYDYDYSGMNNNYNGYNYQPPVSNDKKKKNKNKLWMSIAVVSSVVGACLIGYAIYTITSNSTIANENPIGNNNNQNKSDFTFSSDASYWISERTLSLRFLFKSNENMGTSSSSVQSGTGWIYQADQALNTFYIATNLHVANIVSFNNNTVTSYEGKGYSSDKYVLEEAYVGLDFNVTSEKNDFSNDIYYFKTSIPEIVYTTTTDTTYNNLFNNSQQKYWGLGQNGNAQNFPGATDIAILKYVINPDISTTVFSNRNQADVINKSSYIENFKNWISNYFNNPTKVYKNYVDEIRNELLSGYLYMGGFPSKPDVFENPNSTQNISWLSFSNFKIIDNSNFSGFISSTSFYENTEEYKSNVPIAFYSSSNKNDYTKYNYLSIGYLSLIEADSFSGASGSPIVIKHNGEFEIAGIYWGSISFQEKTTDKNTGETYTYGAMNWFATNSYELKNNDKTPVQYNLTTEIDKKISEIKG
ncbi:MAG: DUF31 family protein [Malacoplasma sp.]|nr:DUF31 family protein [Malacoplasma sp.]MDE7100144.1 DUF31 family protein [Malacoplasma sp.]